MTMRKTLRIALLVAVAVLGIACFVLSTFEGRPWFPWPGRRDVLKACAWSLIAITVSLTPPPSGLRVARLVCVSLACGMLGVGVAALFAALPETVMMWLDIVSSFIFLAAMTINGKAWRKAKKQKETPQETPQ